MREWSGAKTLCNRDGMFTWGDGGQNVREGTFAKGDGRQNVREGTFAKGDGGENVREGTFAKGDLQGHRRSVFMVDNRVKTSEKCLAVLWMLASFLRRHSTMETLNLTV